MKRFLRFIAAIFNVAIAMAVLVGIPYFAHNWGWLMFSWFPALLVFQYLDSYI